MLLFPHLRIIFSSQDFIRTVTVQLYMHEYSPYSNSYGRSFTCITGMVFAGLKSRMVFACSYQYPAISNEQNVDKRHESSCKYVNYERL